MRFFPLHLHVAEVIVDGFADRRLRGDFRLRFGCGDEAVTDGTKLHSLAAGLVYSVLTDGGFAAALAAFAPLDEVGAFGVHFDRPVDADPVFEFAIGLGDGGRKTPGAADFDFPDEVDTIAVSGSVAVGWAMRGVGAGILSILLWGF